MKELITTSTNNAIGLSMVFLACLSLLAGCSNERSASRLLETPTPRSTQMDSLLQDTQSEIAALRRDLAAARIATSKQEGEAAELRRKTTVLEADRAGLRKMLEQAHSTVNALQIQQDELKQALEKAQAISLAHEDLTAPTKLDGTAVQTDMKELKARMAMLIDELAQLKQRFSNRARATSGQTSRESSGQAAEVSPEAVAREKTSQPRLVPRAVFLTPSEQAPQPGPTSDPSPQQGLIRVQPGDSLWKLAHDHATTIDELKRVNGLTTDVVHPGQRLTLPSPISTGASP